MTDTVFPADAGNTTAAPQRRPNARFLLAHPAHFIALGFGSGLSPLAPGTAGTLWAWLAFVVLQSWLSDAQMGMLIAVTLLLAWWACTVTSTHLQQPDSGHIVIDEIVCFWIVLWLVTPASFSAQLVAFALFRLLDAWKPGPMGWADRRFKGFGAMGGLGILIDDLLAAFCTLLLIAAWRFWW